MVAIRRPPGKQERRRITATIEAERAATDPTAPTRHEDALLRELFASFRKTPLPHFRRLLPLLFSLSGKPMTLKDHFPFEPFYTRQLPKSLTFKTARQCGKSRNLAASRLIISVCQPNFNTLFVTPLFEMIRRFSTNYVRDLIDQSNARTLFQVGGSGQNVLQRTLPNEAKLFFSFAFLDCGRIRGLSTDQVCIDEIQDLDVDFIPIIREVMSASPWELFCGTGTPKTLENTSQVVWEQSSQAEWATRCDGCRYWNIASLEFDLDKMMGPTIIRREISEQFPGVICAKCSKPINPRTGHYVHKYPERRTSHLILPTATDTEIAAAAGDDANSEPERHLSFPGYHIPQIIMPMHYANPDKWATLQGKRMGFGNTPINVFYNEVCGEAYDVGARLITVTDLKKAAVLHENSWENALRVRKQYQKCLAAVDWGGGGKEGQSYTTLSVLGMKANGVIDCIYGWRSLTPHDHMREASMIAKAMVELRCSHLVHDYGGAGSLREEFLIRCGFPLARMIPVAYIRAGRGPIMKFVPENNTSGQRRHYQVDKARSLLMVCQLIKLGGLRFFRYDYRGQGNPGLLHDFITLVEDIVKTRFGLQLYTVIRDVKLGPDDFAQSTNIGCCALFYMQKRWPDIAALAAVNTDLPDDFPDLFAKYVDPDEALEE